MRCHSVCVRAADVPASCVHCQGFKPAAIGNLPTDRVSSCLARRCSLGRRTHAEDPNLIESYQESQSRHHSQQLRQLPMKCKERR